MFLEENIKGLCAKYGVDYVEFLSDFGIENVQELSMFDLKAVAEEYDVDLYGLLFKPMFPLPHLQKKLKKIKLLVLDVDGVMTDGGMYFTENGDQFKKFNTKDGMAIIQLTKNNFQVAIISSGFVSNTVKQRAEMLGIQHCFVTRESKIDVLNRLLNELNLDLSQVAIIGDDINDLEVMCSVSVAVCPKDAVQVVKQNCHLVLNTNGGQGCVREFIDNYLSV
jgi:3-deoxy-D-manno-octulosonate 8-phosphate phosphatase (KDO 8-P phosphatase)